MTYALIVMLIVLGILNLLDVQSTNKALSTGTGREANPVMAWMQAELGRFWWVPKALVCVLLAAVVLLTPHSPQQVVLVAALVMFYAWFVIGNYQLSDGS